MAVNIWYFARLREALDCQQERLELDADIQTIEDLLAVLCKRGEQWQKALQDETVLVAVNQAVASLQTTIADEDEIAFFPPVTGG
ncbi:molybdopterin converting factor subunit 1 [Gilvimarinus sp. F26214L]|uniref:molybdopterin converting factor subunit 1 n=1 Tax=Gilvimarinus sp. DZF01 TaxID=3461371 RepID=UPI004046130A